jgi:hypothetical protein
MAIPLMPVSIEGKAKEGAVRVAYIDAQVLALEPEDSCDVASIKQ